jgi:hypothetical protein
MRDQGIKDREDRQKPGCPTPGQDTPSTWRQLYGALCKRESDGWHHMEPKTGQGNGPLDPNLDHVLDQLDWIEKVEILLHITFADGETRMIVQSKLHHQLEGLSYLHHLVSLEGT